MAMVTYAVTGLTCENCRSKVEGILAGLVEQAAVTRGPDRAVLQGGQAENLAALNAALAAQGRYRLAPFSVQGEVRGTVWLVTYRPLLLVVGLALLLALLMTARTVGGGMQLMLDFMGMFFILFAFFKLLNLRGFVEAYARYDVIARRVRGWGWVYPFTELALGMGYLTAWMQPEALPVLNGVTALLMGVGLWSAWGVVRRGETVQCACLGTVFNLPMSTVTLVENGGMLAMALLMLGMW